MAERKIIVVVGATGAQGGGLAKAILADRNGSYAARAITRNPASENARAIAAAGAEVVEADLDNEASLRRAFAGADGAFCVTNFWEHFSAEREVAQAGNLARAAKAAGCRRSAASTRSRTSTAKARAMPRSSTRACPRPTCSRPYYWDNFVHFGSGPKRDESGSLVLTIPMGDRKLPGIAVADIGPCAYGIFKVGSEFIGKSVGIAGEHLSGQEMADGLTRPSASGSSTGTCRGRSTGISGSRARMISATCSSSITTSRPNSAPRGRSSSPGGSIPG